jgi:parallel beta-helix repeat protein
MQFDVVITAKGATIYVGGTGPQNYSTISAGINAANPGDTVFVYNGTYEESLFIDKTISVVGEHRNTTTIVNNDPLPSHIGIIYIEADWVNITGFNISNGDPGIDIGTNNIIISNCHFFNNSYGIEGGDSNNITVSDNVFKQHCFGGVSLSGIGYGHNISDNLFIENVWGADAFRADIINNTFINNDGVRLRGGSWNNITDNIFLNCDDGIFLYHFAHDNYIANNTISNSTRGIHVDDITTTGGPSFNVFLNNTISNSTYGIIIGWEAGVVEVLQNRIISNDIGIYLQEATGSGFISHNEISSNDYGFHHSWSSASFNIKNNTISDNTYGFHLVNCTNLQIYHNNIINNTIQTSDSYYSIQWNNTYPSGGNFWSDYNGSDFFSGPNQDIPGSDGIGDTPYIIDLDSQDNYPLMEPMGNFTFLHPGWNPISISRIQSSNVLVDVLSQINGSYDAVSWYNESESNDPWKTSHSSKPSHMNDLDCLDHTMGFWIHITEPGGVIFNYNGTVPPQNQTIDLCAGWNFVGYPSLSNKYRDEALNNLSFGTHVDAIWTYNSGANRWEEVGELNYFVVGKGYWIHAKEKCVWEVPL